MDKKLPTTIFEAIDHGMGELYFEPLSDGTPTEFAPGSRDKVEVLRKRLEMGEPLFHKGDKIDRDGVATSVQKFNGRRL